MVESTLLATAGTREESLVSQLMMNDTFQYPVMPKKRYD